MLARFRHWLGHRWRQDLGPTLADDYRITFSTLQGQRVLQHLLDNIYCRVYEGTDANAALVHNSRRTVVHEILENIDAGESPQRRDVRMDTEVNLHG